MPSPPRIAIESVEPAQAYGRWRAHRDRFGDTGLWPIVLEPEEVAGMMEAAAEQGASTADDLAEAGDLDGATVLEEDLRDVLEGRDFEDGEEREDVPSLDLDFDPATLATPSTTSFAEEIAEVFRPPSFPNGVRLALVPCGGPWELPAILGHTGGDMYPPSAARHVAILREWQARHGAEPFVFGGDSVHLLVRPIQDREEAKRVAIQQFAYCQDIVDQGVETIKVLAAGLLGASVWFFLVGLIARENRWGR